MIPFPNPTVPLEATGEHTRTSQGCPTHRVLCRKWVDRRDRQARPMRMKVRASMCALFLLVTSLAMPARVRPSRQRGRPPAPTDASYVSALATANRFMHAWQAGDLENGMVLISDGIRRSENADKFEQFFSTSNSKERAFEIGTGYEDHGRYNFPVVLLTPKGDHLTRHSSEITVVNAGKNDWVVDKLP